MSYNDTISDMLTRVRNAVRNHSESVDCRNSNVCQGIAKVLQSEGYAEGFSVIDDGRQGILRVRLSYGPRGELLFSHLRRESKPGCRVYVKATEIPRPASGLGVAVISTPRGVLSDRQARQEHVGGELLCTIQ